MYLIVRNDFVVQSQFMTKEDAVKLINSDYMVFKMNEFGRFDELMDFKSNEPVWGQVEFEFEFNKYE